MHHRFASSLAIRSLAIVLALTIWVAAPTAHAVPLLTGFGGPGGYGTGVLPGNDDGSSSVISLTSAFPGGLTFFGGPYTSFYVNNNGNITFSGPVGTFTPAAFPVASRPMIAPYWADVDTRGGGTPTANGVYWHLEPGRLIVTWHNVGYYSIHDDRQMDFQLVITNALDCRSGDFNVQFRYNTCGWETGDASGGSGGFGGTPAQAGFDGGNGVDYVMIPGSRMSGISTALCTGSNVGMPGIWEFGIRGGAVACPGSGELCDTGMLGACGVGVTQCRGTGTLCAPIGTSSAERCDGLDNDCDGTIDDGDALCGPSEVCSQGSCIPVCFEGGCDEGESCNSDGFCVETACVDVTCPAGQRCSGGACLGACEGISCPHGQQCVAGRCTDLCDVLECDTGEVCVDGACVAQCPCRACEDDEICGSDGSCTPVGCDIVLCDPGFYCEAGACLDACDGAVCPQGQRCEQGACVDGPAPQPDAGPPVGVDGGGTVADAGTESGFDAGPLEIDGGRRPTPRARGCSCAVPERGPAPAWGFVLAALGLAITWRRRR